MRFIVQEEGVIDARTMPSYALTQELTKIASGARTTYEVEERIRARFLPKPQVWVSKRGLDHWGILLQLEPGRESASYYIPKK